MKDDIKLPPLPKGDLVDDRDGYVGYTAEQARDIQKAAIKADRQLREEQTITTFHTWLYRVQDQFDTDDLNKREIELAQLAWEEAQSTVPEGWQLVPKELIDFLDAKEHHLPVEDRHVLSIMLAAAPKFGEE